MCAVTHRAKSYQLIKKSLDDVMGPQNKFPVFSLTGNFLGHFPCFPCAVGTLLYIYRRFENIFHQFLGL